MRKPKYAEAFDHTPMSDEELLRQAERIIVDAFDKGVRREMVQLSQACSLLVMARNSRNEQIRVLYPETKENPIDEVVVES